MSKRLTSCAVLLAGLLALPAAAQTPVVAGAPESTAIKAFVTFPDAAPTENICQQANGDIYVTMMDSKKVAKISPAGVISDFVSIPGAVAVIGVACGNNEIAVSIFTKQFRLPSGTAAFTDTGAHLLFYDLAGKQKADVTLPANVAINGFDYGGDGAYYGGDSNSGTVFRIDAATHALTPFWQDASFGPVAGNPMGINGVRAKNGWVYFSGAQKNGIFKTKIGAGGKAEGALLPVELGIRVDDFDVADDGSVYFPNGRVLFKVAPNGAMTIVADPIPGGPSAVVSNDSKTVYWPTRGGTAPQRVMQFPIQ